MSTSTQSECAENRLATAESESESETQVVENQDSVDRDFYLDWLERYLIGGFYCWFLVRLVDNYLDEGNIRVLFLIPSEGLVLLFILIRRSGQAMTRQPIAWILAIAAGCVPLFVAPTRNPSLVPLTLGGMTMLLGTLVQIHAKITLGRSFGCVPAHRGLKLGGPYQFVRHPMYAGYLLSHLAFLGLNPSWWNLGVYTISVALMIPRLLLEERLLKNDPCYCEYQSVVRYRLIPGVF